MRISTAFKVVLKLVIGLMVHFTSLPKCLFSFWIIEVKILNQSWYLIKKLGFLGFFGVFLFLNSSMFPKNSCQILAPLQLSKWRQYVKNLFGLSKAARITCTNLLVWSFLVVFVTLFSGATSFNSLNRKMHFRATSFKPLPMPGFAF